MRRLLFAVLATAALACAGEKKLMHCFAFSTIDTATPAEWQAFIEATNNLPNQIPGVSRIWIGKLRKPLALAGPADAESNRAVLASKRGEQVSAQVIRIEQQFGVCMEMADESALRGYASHPAHKAWYQLYKKVRHEGSTTYDILGQ